MIDLRCDSCGNYRDTPLHELGCWAGRRESFGFPKAAFTKVDLDVQRLDLAGEMAVQRACDELMREYLKNYYEAVANLPPLPPWVKWTEEFHHEEGPDRYLIWTEFRAVLA